MPPRHLAAALWAALVVLGGGQPARRLRGEEQTQDDANQTQATLNDDGKRTKISFQDEGLLVSILQAEKRQPFYVMPILSGLKTLMTFLIFGFSVRFEKREDGQNGQTFAAKAKRAAAVAAGCGSILLAANSWYCDFQRAATLGAETSCLQKVLGIMIICVTSPNYIASISIWVSLILQAPPALLNAKPKYDALPFGIPVVPGGAAWLPLEKHLYALLLLPYFAVRYFNMILFTTMSSVGCMTKAGCCHILACCRILQTMADCIVVSIVSLLKLSLCLMCSLLGVVVSLGSWQWARQSLGHWWGLAWPLLYFVAVQFWAFVVTPLLFLMIYGAFRGISARDACKSILLHVGFRFYWPLQIQMEEVKKFREYNAHLLGDFDEAYDYQGLAERWEQRYGERSEFLQAVGHQHELQRHQKGWYWSTSWACAGCATSSSEMEVMHRCDACHFALCDRCYTERQEAEDQAAGFKPLREKWAEKVEARSPELVQKLAQMDHEHELRPHDKGMYWMKSWTCAGCSKKDSEMDKMMRCDDCKFALCPECHKQREEEKELDRKAEMEREIARKGAEQFEQNVGRYQSHIVWKCLAAAAIVGVDQLVWVVFARSLPVFLERDPDNESFFLFIDEIITVTLSERTMRSYLAHAQRSMVESASIGLDMFWALL